MGRPWQEPDGGVRLLGPRSTCTPPSTPPAAPTTAAATSTSVYGDWDVAARRTLAPAGRPTAAPRAAATRDVARRAAARRRRPGGAARPAHTDAALALFARRRPGAGRAGAARRRPAPRHRRRRRHLRGQPQHQLHQRLLRRLPVLRVRPARARRRRVPALAGPGRRPGRAGLAEAGATEVCMQGGIDPKLPVTAYADLVRAVKAAGARHARARVLARWRSSPAPAKAGVSDRGLADRAARGRAGHHPRHRRRDPRRRGALGAHQGQAAGRRLGRGGQHGARAGHPVQLHDDVRPRRPPAALARPPAGAGRHPGPNRRLHRVRAAAVRAPQRADLPGRHRPARARPGGRTGPCTRWPGCCCTGGSTTSSAPG